MREALLQPRVDGHLEGEARAAVAERAHRLGALVQVRHDDQPREVLPVLIAADEPERRVVRKGVGRRRLDRVAALGERRVPARGRARSGLTNTSPSTPSSFSSGPKPRLAAIPSERPAVRPEEEEELLRAHRADHVGADERRFVVGRVGQQIAIGAERRRRSVVEDAGSDRPRSRRRRCPCRARRSSCRSTPARRRRTTPTRCVSRRPIAAMRRNVLGLGRASKPSTASSMYGRFSAGSIDEKPATPPVPGPRRWTSGPIALVLRHAGGRSAFQR